MSEVQEVKEIDCRFKWTDNGKVCTPIRTYEELIKLRTVRPLWKDGLRGLLHVTDVCYPGISFECHNCGIEVTKRRRKRSEVPKTLFCHDLKGGYLDDRFVDGSSKHEEYRFFHWAGIDTFVYFSHHLVTIPPPVWINAAHLHGTKVLGTVITEWTDGEKVWDKITASEATVEEFVDCLVSICLNFGFDGYLLNVENKIPAEKVPKLEMFVTLLNNKLHAQVPHSELIWYDSVTSEGKLDWQNELNEKNRVFFDKCDGIFLNYSWEEENLAKSALNAGARNLDVYVGIDVFGRNFYEGGGYNSYKAAELARKHNLSMALFAPSWVHEYFAGAHFVNLEYVFWNMLWPFLYLHVPQDLPFTTTFCQGYGEKMYKNGQVTSSLPWYNLSKQQYQPSVPSCQSEKFVEILVNARKKDGSITEEISEEARKLMTCGCVQHYSMDALTGGGCLLISQPCSEAITQRILKCNFKCTGDIVVSVATKLLDGERGDLSILLFTEDNEGGSKEWILKPGVRRTSSSDKNSIHPLKQAEIDELKHKVPQDSLETLSLSAMCDWKLRHYVLELQETILEVRVQRNSPGTSVLLGLFQIIPLWQ